MSCSIFQTKLNVPDLELELEVNATRWTYLQGLITCYHTIAWDFDGYAMEQLSKIALGVIEDLISLEEALQKINDVEESEKNFDRRIGSSFERFYRNLPGRIALVPLLASTGATVYFDGTWVDFGVTLVTGSVAGVIHYICMLHPQLAGVQDVLVSISTGMISSTSMVLFPDSVCTSAQILGTLFWFLYGISFTLSLYEMTQGLTMTGLTRFALSILNSFVLAFGVVIGIWMAAWAGPQRFDSMLQDCSTLEYHLNPAWLYLLYPLVALGALMQLRISLRYFGICLLVQLIAVGSQYLLIERWEQPIFVNNFLPAFGATIAAHVCISISARFSNLDLSIPQYVWKHFDRQAAQEVSLPSPLPPPVRDLRQYPQYSKTAQDHRSLSKIEFRDSGWADVSAVKERLSIEGYVRDEKFQYQRSDLWFCLIPALYLLVPGCSVWKIAFFSIIDAADGGPMIHGGESDNFSMQALISGVFVIGIAQVIGVRLAISLLWIIDEFQTRR